MLSKDEVTTSFGSMSARRKPKIPMCRTGAVGGGGANFQPAAQIADDLGGIVIDTPGGQERLQVG